MIMKANAAEPSDAICDQVTGPHPRFEPVEDEVIFRDQWGDVIAGFDLESGSPVSITRVDVLALGDAESQHCFWQRARRSCELENPHVLRVIEVDELRCWIVTEAIVGSWSPRPKPRVAAENDHLVRDVRRLLMGLSDINSRGFVCGAIHPQDLCNCEDRRVVLRCLAPYSALADVELPQVKLHSPFAAPELHERRGSDPTDVSFDTYSLGVAISERLMGENLSQLARIDAGCADWAGFTTSTQPWEPLEKHVSNISPTLAKVINRMITKRTSDRYATAGAALADFGGSGSIHSEDLAAAPSSRGKNVVIQRSPMTKDITESHFKAINPVDPDRETNIEKFFSPERIYAWAKKPLVLAALFLTAAAFFVLNRKTPVAIPTYSMSLSVRDSNQSPLTDAVLTLKGGAGANQTVELGAESEITLPRVPQGTYELTVAKPGYVKKSIEMDVDADLSTPITFVLADEKIPEEPIAVVIRPQSPDGAVINCAFYERTHDDDSPGRLLHSGQYFEIEELQPGTEKAILIRAAGYHDERVEINYADFSSADQDAEVLRILQPAPRSLILQVNQRGTTAWVNREKLTQEQKQESELGDTYKVEISHGAEEMVVEIHRAGCEVFRELIKTQDDKKDVVKTCSLIAVAYPLRTIKSLTKGVRVSVDGRYQDSTPCALSIPDGQHTIELERADGQQRRYQVWFHDNRNNFNFDF